RRKVAVLADATPWVHEDATVVTDIESGTNLRRRRDAYAERVPVMPHQESGDRVGEDPQYGVTARVAASPVPEDELERFSHEQFPLECRIGGTRPHAANIRSHKIEERCEAHPLLLHRTRTYPAEDDRLGRLPAILLAVSSRFGSRSWGSAPPTCAASRGRLAGPRQTRRSRRLRRQRPTCRPQPCR